MQLTTICEYKMKTLRDLRWQCSLRLTPDESIMPLAAHTNLVCLLVRPIIKNSGNK
jgi:hypothetical protein